MTERKLSRRIPIFVYGTMRPEQGNTWPWDGRGEALHDGAATVRGYALVAHEYGYFPYAVREPGAVTVGALVVPYREDYDAVLADMDHLEGYPRHYDRVLCLVTTPDGEEAAWIYTPVALRHDHLHPVPGNDWATYRKEPTR